MAFCSKHMGSRRAVVLLLCILAVIFNFVLFKSYCKYFINFLRITFEGYSLEKSCCNSDELASLVVFIDESLILVGLLWTSLIKCGRGLPIFHFGGRRRLDLGRPSRTYVSALASTRGPVIPPTFKRVTAVSTIWSDGRQRAELVRVSPGQRYHDGSTSDSRPRPPGWTSSVARPSPTSRSRRAMNRGRPRCLAGRPSVAPTSTRARPPSVSLASHVVALGVAVSKTGIHSIRRHRKICVVVSHPQKDRRYLEKMTSFNAFCFVTFTFDLFKRANVSAAFASAAAAAAALLRDIKPEGRHITINRIIET